MFKPSNFSSLKQTSIKSLGLLAAGLPMSIMAQQAPPPPATAETTNNAAAPAVSAGLVNDWLRQQSPDFDPWDFGGQFRARLEVKDYIDTPGQAGQVAFRHEHGDANNTYLLIRQKVHVGFNSDWFSAFLEGQESSSTGDKRDPNLESDIFDLHQGYVTLGDLKEFPLMAKVGRQEMNYGDQRLIGAFDWNNIGRTFDAIKLRYVDNGTWVDAFTSRVVIPKDNNFDVSDNYDTFSGLYASSTDLMPWQESQVYFLARNTSDGAPNFETGALVPLPAPRDIYTPGLRLKSLPGKLNGFDYTLEGDYQFGRYVPVTGSAPTAVISKTSLNQHAYLVHVDAGYTWTCPWSPRADVEFNYASGDHSAKDGTHGTFDTLYPTTHLITGIMDLYCMQNIEDLRLNLSARPTEKFGVQGSYRGVWLATSSDSFYLANQAPRTGGTPGVGNGFAINPTFDRYVGMEADLVLTYDFAKWAQLQGGYGHFFVGSYVKESLSAPGFGATDANYIYLQAKLNF